MSRLVSTIVVVVVVDVAGLETLNNIFKIMLCLFMLIIFKRYLPRFSLALARINFDIYDVTGGTHCETSIERDYYSDDICLERRTRYFRLNAGLKKLPVNLQ